MLDQELKEQLKSVFAPLDSTITFVYYSSSHENQSELLTLLEDICSTYPSHLKMQKIDTLSPMPRFYLLTPGNKTPRIYFSGIPGGHEFTSLILAILHSDHKGKMPDSFITQRIQKLKGPIRLKTYISLTCENCPDVVQALNQMAILHPDFQHEMIDGAYVQDEIDKLGIQGVPSIIINNELIHSGRIHFLDLLKKLETHFGVEEIVPSVSGKSESLSASNNLNLGHFDVVVIGGGPAGVSAAIYSVRKGLKTAILSETIGGQIQETKGIENMISVVYTEGPQLVGQLKEHLASYPVQVFEHRRVKFIEQISAPTAPTTHSTLSGKLNKLTLESKEYLSADAVIVATGAKWRELGVPGEKNYIGRGVAFCPHCDGPYYKGKKVAIIGGGNSGVEAAIDLAGIVKEVTLVEYQEQLKADHVLVTKLKSLSNVQIMTSTKIIQILGDGNKVNAVELEDRRSGKSNKIELDGVFVQIGLIPNSQFLKDLVETTPFGEIKVDGKGRTSLPGIYAAGDVTITPYKQIIIAMGEGAKAALAAFSDRMG